MKYPHLPIPELTDDEIAFVREFIGPHIASPLATLFGLPTGCQPWLGSGGITSRSELVRPTVKLRDRTWAANRIAYSIAKGTIPEGLVVDHLCKWAKCINADHLEPVTQEQNQRREGPRYQLVLAARARTLRALLAVIQPNELMEPPAA